MKHGKVRIITWVPKLEIVKLYRVALKVFTRTSVVTDEYLAQNGCLAQI